MFWGTLPEQKTTMDTQHFYDREHIRPLGPVNHVRLNIFPDGGVSRLRIWGRLVISKVNKEMNEENFYGFAESGSADQRSIFPFGNVIEIAGSDWFPINNGSTRRYHKLGLVDVCGDDGFLPSVWREDCISIPTQYQHAGTAPSG
jgi:hypothetical protein